MNKTKETSLSKLALYKSKNLILHWIADFSGTWTSILGHEMPSRTRCSTVPNNQVVPLIPTLSDADLRFVWSCIILLQQLWHYNVQVILCDICWHRYPISPKLSLLTDGIGKYAVPDLPELYAQDCPVHLNLDHKASQSCSFTTSE